MLMMYVVYCVTLYFNPRLEQWAQTLPVPCKKVAEQEGPVTYQTLDDPPALESPDKINFGAPPGEHVPGSVPQSQPQQAYYRSREADPNEVCLIE